MESNEKLYCCTRTGSVKPRLQFVFFFYGSLLPKNLHSDLIFVFTAAGVVPCGGRKSSSRASS